MTVDILPFIIAAAIALIAFILYISHRRTERLRYEFITIIAHKFRTPLTQIKWSAESLLTGTLDPYQRQSIADIQTSNENLIGLTGALIELTDPDNSARSAYKFERIILCDLIREAAAAAKTAFHEKNIFIAIECPDPALSVRADRTRLRFAVDTILENACLYSPPGRDVDIAIGRRGRKALVSVTDHGIGIEPHDQPHIFDRFYRAKNARSMNTEGVGIGLYLARSIIRRHRGTIKVYSEGMNKGSTVTVVLPRVK